MKPIKLTESEKKNILKLYNSNILIEQSAGKTIADIQKLVGTDPDNKLGPKTLAAIKTKLGQPDKVTTATIDGYTYEQMKGLGWTDEQLAKSKYKSLIPTTPTTSDGTTTTTPTIDGFTYDDMKAAGWTDELLANTKFKSLIPTTPTTSSEQNKTELPSDTGQVKPIEMSQIKVKGITTAPTESGYKVDTERVVDTNTF